MLPTPPVEAMRPSYFPLRPKSPILHQPFGTVFGASCSCKICLLLYLFVSCACCAHGARSCLCSHVFLATSVRLCRYTRSSTQFTGCVRVGVCLPSPPVAFLKDPLFPGVNPLFSCGGPPLSLRRTFPYQGRPRVLKRSDCGQGCFGKNFFGRLKLLKGARYKDCTRCVILAPLTVELQLEAQTFPFLPISGP